MGCPHSQDNNTFVQHPLSNIKHIVGVVSGKGGVGKSLVTGSVAVSLERLGFKVGILDADITGPTIAHMFGLNDAELQNVGNLLLPNITKTGIKIMSANAMLARKDDPIIWRAPLMVGAIRQFLCDCDWGDLDYLLVDMPPGTSDIALTVFQNIVLDGIIVVSTPQSLVNQVVGKAVRMAQKMNVDVLGIVENMSYIACPNCNEPIEAFGKSTLDTIAHTYQVTPLDKLPLLQSISQACDEGTFEDVLPEQFIPRATEEVIVASAVRELSCVETDNHDEHNHA